MTSKSIADSLRDIAADYLTAERQVDSFEVSDHLMRGASQLRFIAVLVATAPDGYYDELGEAWLSAGPRFLTALLERAEDEVHESRADRRAPKPSDTMAAKRTYARQRPDVSSTMTKR